MTAQTKSETQALAVRLKRAYDGLKDASYRVERVNARRWKVTNTTGLYHVERTDERWTCSCPDFGNRGLTCKHIFMVFLHEKAKRGVSIEDAYERIRSALQDEPTASRAIGDAVAILEANPAAVKPQGSNAWRVEVSRLPGHPEQVGTYTVQRRDGRWSCSACGATECAHALAVQIDAVIRRGWAVAPLSAARLLLEQRDRQAQTHSLSEAEDAPEANGEDGALEALVAAIREQNDLLREIVSLLRSLQNSPSQSRRHHSRAA